MNKQQDLSPAIDIHPAADVFPPMSPDELKQLSDDIAVNGLIHPVMRNAAGVILDGRNRLRACEIAGIEPRYEEFKGDDATAFIVSTNLVRRHLSESQRAKVAAKLAALSQHGGDRRSEPAAANLPLEKMKQSVAAVMMNISERSIRHAGVVRKHGTPELIRDVEAGKISVSAAAKLTRPPPTPQPAPKPKPQSDKPVIYIARIKSAFIRIEKAAANRDAKLFQKGLRELIEAAKEQIR